MGPRELPKGAHEHWGRAGNPTEPLGAIMCHLGVDAHVGTRKSLPGDGGAKFDVLRDHPGRTAIADGADKPGGIQMD
jgi:hypothetical protein